MRRQDGFTLLELMLTLAIVGILSATAIPLYHTWTQRAYGTEASLMMKQILDGEVMYYLEHDEFFPGAGEVWIINADGTTTPNSIDVIGEIKEALKVQIPPGHRLQYDLSNTGTGLLVVTISSENLSFPLFKGGVTTLTAGLDTEGKVEYY
jgi:prepilin-type N-terminal cleavage/methylation domain-containing protein